jgi:hypothetical protein
MGLKLTRRPTESFSVYDGTGQRLLRVTLLSGGAEPLLDVDAPRSLVIKRDDRPTDPPLAPLPRAA